VRIASRGSQPFWSGSLQPLVEDGQLIQESYGRITSTLFVDDQADYYTFWPMPTSKQIVHFYNSVYPSSRRQSWYNAVTQYDPRRWHTLIARVDQLAAPLRQAGTAIRVHDVGCNFGGLVQMLHDRAYVATGTDLSREAVNGGKVERLNQWIYDGTAITFLRKQPRQHIIILNHVLEHARYPFKLINSLTKFLAPGGCILVRCPNSRFILSQLTSIRANWYGYPKHLHYFGPKSLSRLLELSGLCQVELRSTDTDMRIAGETERLLCVARTDRYPVDDVDQLIELLLTRMETKEIEAVGRRAS
jgi:2-polyprenyl-3-methyl-5-hydroxy-6-metoxy-1,4-benzoquinol methylase